MEPELLDRFREVIHAESGIALSPRKEALIRSRIGKRLHALGLDSYAEYMDRLTREDGADEVVHLLDAVSTNVTSFFREPAHFEIIQQHVAEWADQGQKRFRFWSAACSTGEEPYSLAMTLDANFSARNLDMRILATDISTRVLEHAKTACYEERHVTPVPDQYRAHLRPVPGGGTQKTFEVSKTLRDMVVFRRMNLSQPPFPMAGPLDIIMCRNVMIYFDNPVRLALLAEFERLLKPGGLLLVGHAESLAGMLSNLKYVAPSVYVKL